jgi:soluble lytic murein transglycosylase-like protein
MEQGDRRQADRRAADRRRYEPLFGGRREGERRRFGRRKMAGAGILAVVALATGRSHGKQLIAPLAGDPSSIEVTADNFHLPSYDRASLEPLIQEAAAEHGVSADLVRAVIQTESQFNPLAVSPVGAAGLMQLMPHTAKRVGIDNPFDPRENVFGGVKYLSMMMSRFKGNTALALAGYNAGPEKVKRHRGIPPYRETQGYVRKIQKLLADTDAAFSLPVVKKKPRRATLRASARRGAAVKRASVRGTAKSRKAVVKPRTPSKRVALRTPAKATKKPVRKSTRRTRASLRG